MNDFEKVIVENDHENCYDYSFGIGDLIDRATDFLGDRFDDDFLVEVTDVDFAFVYEFLFVHRG